MEREQRGDVGQRTLPQFNLHPQSFKRPASPSPFSWASLLQHQPVRAVLQFHEVHPSQPGVLPHWKKVSAANLNPFTIDLFYRNFDNVIRLVITKMQTISKGQIVLLWHHCMLEVFKLLDL